MIRLASPFRATARLAALAGVLALAACGGGGGDPVYPVEPPSYGAAAASVVGNVVSDAFITGMTSAEIARSLALSSCGRLGTACEVIAQWGPGQCGAIATGLSATRTFVYGGGVAATFDDARSAAVANCTARGGLTCTASSTDCSVQGG
jgi:hypothetical protein